MSLYEVSIGKRTYRVQIEPAQAPSNAAQEESTARGADEAFLQVRLDGRETSVNYRRVKNESLSLIVNGKSYEVRQESAGEVLRIILRGRTYECSVRDPRSLRSRRRTGVAEGGAQRITASMPGKVVRVLVKTGDPISSGQGILVIEAMKMQNEVRSPKEGVLKQLAVREGANVNAGEILAIIE